MVDDTIKKMGVPLAQQKKVEILASYFIRKTLLECRSHLSQWGQMKSIRHYNDRLRSLEIELNSICDDDDIKALVYKLDIKFTP